MLLERDESEPMTAVVVEVGDGGVLVDPTCSAPAPAAGPLLVSVFAPEALYRITATATVEDQRVRLTGFRGVEIIQRRRWPRREMTMPVSLIPADDAAPVGVLGETVDIGVGGTRVRTGAPLPGGGDPLVALTLPDGDVLVLAARVVHAETGPDHCDYRLAFRDLDGGEAAQLAELVAAVPA
jgi:hypothetical protein